MASVGQWVIYHAPGGADIPALVVSVADDGTPNISPFTDVGQHATEGTNAGQWSALP